MRHHAAVTSISWIPSEAVGGLNKAVFGTGLVHDDDPPPDVIDDLERLCGEDRFRLANHLAAWVEIDDVGSITDAGYEGGCVMGATTIAIGSARATFAGVAPRAHRCGGSCGSTPSPAATDDPEGPADYPAALVSGAPNRLP